MFFFAESLIDKSQIQLTEGAGFDWIPLTEVFKYDLTEKTRNDLKLFLRRL